MLGTLEWDKDISPHGMRHAYMQFIAALNELDIHRNICLAILLLLFGYEFDIWSNKWHFTGIFMCIWLGLAWAHHFVHCAMGRTCIFFSLHFHYKSHRYFSIHWVQQIFCLLRNVQSNQFYFRLFNFCLFVCFGFLIDILAAQIIKCVPSIHAVITASRPIGRNNSIQLVD